MIHARRAHASALGAPRARPIVALSLMVLYTGAALTVFAPRCYTGAAVSHHKEVFVKSFLFSGYARLPQDVSHQALYSRVGVVVEVDETGVILGATSSLMMDLSRDFFGRLVTGLNVVTERDLIERSIRERYRGHSQGALVSALRKVYEAVDHSPLVAEQSEVAGAAADGGHGV